VLTVEDPVEYELPGIGQTQVNPKIDLTFAKALRAILRQDPDVIMIGEIRDHETAQIAIQASLTGHLVLATVHTNDAPSSVTRLIDMGVEPFLLSSSLLGVLAQRLVRKLCPHCRKPGRDDGHWHPVGCAGLRHTGYKGRTGVYELMVVNAAGAVADPQPRRRGRCWPPRAPRPALDARGRRAPGRRRHHLAEEVLRVTRE
jgi:general secretion pathway protein E